MRRLAALAALSIATFGAFAPAAEAQIRRQRGEALILTVRPRSYLDAGKVVPVGSMNQYATIFGGNESYVISPPYFHTAERFGASVLPNPIGAGRNAFGPLDYRAPDFVR